MHHLTAPLRAAARERGDADGFHLWAGQAHALAGEEPAGELVRRLAAEAAAALEDGDFAAAERVVRTVCPAKKEDLPGTIERSPKKVQDTYEKTLDSAHEQYDSEERAHRTAFASVKHVAEKKGDHWELKDEQGPSDPQAEQSGRAARDNPKRTYGGVDANKSKQELYEDAKEAGIEGRSDMSKEQLAEALQKHSERESRARSSLSRRPRVSAHPEP